DAGITQRDADFEELIEGRRRHKVVLGKDFLVVDHGPLAWIPNRKAIGLAVKRGLLDGKRIGAADPFLIAQVYPVLLDIVEHAQISLAALPAKDIGCFTGVEARGQHIEVLVGGYHLKIDVDT